MDQLHSNSPFASAPEKVKNFLLKNSVQLSEAASVASQTFLDVRDGAYLILSQDLRHGLGTALVATLFNTGNLRRIEKVQRMMCKRH
jgi:hypothetical protein